MHKSAGNAIEFDEAADRMGVDVMRWMFANARPEDNILFGWHAADESRRGLLVLWNVYSFFVRYAPLAGWTPPVGRPATSRDPRDRGAMDRWILSRAAGLADAAGATPGRLRRPSARPALIGTFMDELSTWYLRLSRRALLAQRRRRRPRRRLRARCTRRSSRWPRSLAPILPFLSESIYGNIVAPGGSGGARLRAPDALAGGRAGGVRASPSSRPPWTRPGGPWSWPARCAARPASRAASRWPGCGLPCPAVDLAERDALLALHRATRSTSRRSSSSATSRRWWNGA